MKKLILLITLITSSFAFSQSQENVPAVMNDDKNVPDKEKTLEEKKMELVNFDKIKEVLKEDQLLDEANRKKSKVSNKGKKRIDWNQRRYNIPKEDEFWDFLSELWLVKRATQLKWDFEKPAYGIDSSFKEFLEKMGIYEVSFKILVVNSPKVFHMALPSRQHKIFILSLPFIRTMDLSKSEINLLLLEDFKRLESGVFINKLKSSKMLSQLGSNFYKKKFNNAHIDELLKMYDQIAFEKGFNFQEQFGVTQQMDIHLKSDLKEWGKYYNLLQKIDDLVKNNALFRDYNKIYPSPELQMNWLKPKSKKI